MHHGPPSIRLAGVRGEGQRLASVRPSESGQKVELTLLPAAQT